MAYTNKEDQARAAHRHYINNKEKIKKRSLQFNKMARKRNTEFTKQYLSTHPCVDCGVGDVRVLEFDHVNGIKNENISDMVNCPVSLTTLQSEISKCEIRCANCHRIRTTEQRGEV